MTTLPSSGSPARQHEPQRTTAREPVFPPPAPRDSEETGVPRELLHDLVLRFATTVPSLTAVSAAAELALPDRIVEELCEALREEKALEALGAAGPLAYRYAITELGRDRARRLLAINAWVGPAPVALEDYCALLEAQLSRLPTVSPELVAASLAPLVLPPEAVEVVGLACLSGRTLLVHGPAGNGKTELGRLLHGALEGELWIPTCLAVDGSIVRLFDPHVHERLPVLDAPSGRGYDRRWVRIRRPLVVVGGELTLDALELQWDESIGCHEAPLHVKANGGTFLLDDFGCQRAEPSRLLARWVHPLEHRVDHLTLRTGKQVQVPFRQMLVVSTNLDPELVMEPAFLRRVGYRVLLGAPSEAVYRAIFEAYADRAGVSIPEGLLDRLLARYDRERRERRGCESRDLIERVRDLCRYRGRAFELDEDLLDRAWRGYFGEGARGRVA